MRIIVHSCANRARRETLREAANLFCRELLSPEVYNETKLEIFVNPKLKSYFGACAALRPQKGKPQRSFHVELHPHKWRVGRLLRTLGHECVHLKQFAMGEMLEPSGKAMKKITVWKKREINHEELPYHKHPWEIEASMNEENLWMLWKIRKTLDVSLNRT